MPGLKIVLPLSFGDPTLPKVLDDPVLTNGSVFLADGSHSLGRWTGTADQTKIPNIAWKYAQAMIPAGTQDTLGGLWNLTGGAPHMMVERTSCGGTHIIMSQVNDVTNAASRAWMAPRGLIQSYIDSNTETREFYFEYWIRMTRRSVDVNVTQGIGMKTDQFNYNNNLFNSPNNGIQPGSGTRLKGSTSSPTQVLSDTGVALGTPIFRAVSILGYGGTKPDMAGSGDSAGVAHNAQGVHFGYGHLDAMAAQAANTNKMASLILERLYIEDCTTSGRSHATISAIGKAEFDKQHAVGGRYYNDVYTNPTLFP